MSQRDDPQASTEPLSPADAAAVDAAFAQLWGALPARGPAKGPALRLAQQGEPDGAGLACPDRDGAQALALGAEVDPARVAKVRSLLALLERCPAEAAPADLGDRVFASILSVQDRDRASEDDRGGPIVAVPFRWSELIAVAAMLILGASVVWPVLEHNRAAAREVACRQSLHQGGEALALYAGANKDMMPRGLPRSDGAWFLVGKTTDPDAEVRSNSANLYRLVSDHYISPAALNCPESQHTPEAHAAGKCDWSRPDAVPFSYQNQFGKAVKLDENPQMIALADRNPQFRIDSGRFEYLQQSENVNSTRHGGRGQNVLLNDGSVYWTTKPTLPNGDVIYTAAGVRSYTGSEIPAGPDDGFAVP